MLRALLRAVSRSLGLEEGEPEAALGMASTLQIFIANLYPRYPDAGAAMGMPAHSDHGLFTLLVENGVGGLQIQHDGSNGIYKSVLHRAVVNGEKTRISVAMANGPSRDVVVESRGCARPAY
ncbi:hypothetical protein SASPL_115462 [Salvia splendens]|uniref:Isopenicillin N synthase-like Fe(2+) 2OG dioxygenase domain-containing protein n=1 Tax=Salvia splendens TaxID=180675 RepID=A0A8X9A323_SALSN|nr:hypothetical protein SASPL_115462 [Salvia splendens]